MDNETEAREAIRSIGERMTTRWQQIGEASTLMADAYVDRCTQFYTHFAKMWSSTLNSISGNGNTEQYGGRKRIDPDHQ